MTIPVLAAALGRGSRDYLKLIISVELKNAKLEKQAPRIVVKSEDEYSVDFSARMRYTLSGGLRGELCFIYSTKNTLSALHIAFFIKKSVDRRYMRAYTNR